MIKRELGIFLIVGTLTVVLDFVLYRGLIHLGGIGVATAKTISFLAGTSFSYFANRFCTFGHRSHPSGTALRFGLLYATTLGTNVLINSLMLKLFTGIPAVFPLAFLIATAVSAILNFLGLKFFVFKENPVSEIQ
jgi:putative flippase GtrA